MIRTDLGCKSVRTAVGSKQPIRPSLYYKARRICGNLEEVSLNAQETVGEVKEKLKQVAIKIL